MFTPDPRPLATPREVWPYPKGYSRLLLRAPLLLYRLGLGELLARSRLVVLTTRGRKSGLPRRAIVEYRMHGSRVYLISGWGQRPQWVKNLLADPIVTVQAGPRTYVAQAHLVEDPGEVLRALFLFRRPAPEVYDMVFARLTDQEHVRARDLPDLADQLTVIRLDIEDRRRPPLATLKPDLIWVWGAAVFSLAGIIFAIVNFRKQN